MKNIINWKLFFILVIVCIIASMLVIPYSLDLTSSEIEITPVIMLATAAQNLVLFAVAAFFGLLLSKRIGMGLPILQNVLEGKNQIKELKHILPSSVGLGVLSGVLIVCLSIPFNRLIPEFQNVSTSVPAWKAFLASFYGGIAEEVLLRLFLVSLFVWITFKIKKNKDGYPQNIGIWLSIILAAIIFGLGHLPATAQITPLTGLVIIRAIMLNGIGGIIFGWLYWKKGLESAMIAHFSADIVLHVITPAVVSFFS
ncbi:abortive infection protein [Spirochaetia bacterium]|nr:abortive infection protein [Spirochaetia bacterium]